MTSNTQENELQVFLDKQDRIREKVVRSWKYYAPVFAYTLSMIDEEDVINHYYNLWGDATINVSCESMTDMSRIIGNIAKHCSLKIIHAPSEAEFKKSTELLWILLPRTDEDTSIPSITITCSAKNCRLVQVGEETITKPIYEVECD